MRKLKLETLFLSFFFFDEKIFRFSNGVFFSNMKFKELNEGFYVEVKFILIPFMGEYRFRNF